MSTRGFGPVLWAGTVAGAALGFYLVSLSVASERAELENVETRIALAQRDIRLLQTEIGTRGRLAQLERWNVRFIRLSAPTADQFVDGGFRLATLATPQKKPAIEAPVVLASAPLEQAVPQQPRLTGDDGGTGPGQNGLRAPEEMVHVASYTVPAHPSVTRSVPVREFGERAARRSTSEAEQRREPATKPSKSAMADPLAPLPGARSKAKGGTPAPAEGGTASQAHTPKDRVTDR